MKEPKKKNKESSMKLPADLLHRCRKVGAALTPVATASSVARAYIAVGLKADEKEAAK